jgi:ammonia channel protein AmtB
MELIVLIFGLLGFIVMIIGFINGIYIKNENLDDILNIAVHISAGILGGLAISILFGGQHIIDEHEYKEYKELKQQYMNSPNLFNANNQTCWNINGAKHCGEFTYEDNKTKIEVKNGSTNITVK